MGSCFRSSIGDLTSRDLLQNIRGSYPHLYYLTGHIVPTYISSDIIAILRRNDMANMTSEEEFLRLHMSLFKASRPASRMHLLATLALVGMHVLARRFGTWRLMPWRFSRNCNGLFWNYVSKFQVLTPPQHLAPRLPVSTALVLFRT
jgi:hypothetical protein